LETQKKETREKINRLKWLESLETNKLYKNQQKLEKATNNLARSKKEIVAAQNQLKGLETQLVKASAEYRQLNALLATHVRNRYKVQRKAMFESIINSLLISKY
jgi:phosphoketolase